MYNGKKYESYLQARIHLYKHQKENTSLSLYLDPDLLLQALEQAQLQTLVWCQCNMVQIKHFNPELYGWYGLHISSNFLYGLLVHSFLLLCKRAIEKGKILHLMIARDQSYEWRGWSFRGRKSELWRKRHRCLNNWMQEMLKTSPLKS